MKRIKKSRTIAVIAASMLKNNISNFKTFTEGKVIEFTYNQKLFANNLNRIVLQDSVIFSDTIENNIKYGKSDAKTEDVIAAAKMAGVDSFARKLPNGYKTVLLENDLPDNF